MARDRRISKAKRKIIIEITPEEHLSRVKLRGEEENLRYKLAALQEEINLEHSRIAHHIAQMLLGMANSGSLDTELVRKMIEHDHKVTAPYRSIEKHYDFLHKHYAPLLVDLARNEEGVVELGDKSSPVAEELARMEKRLANHVKDHLFLVDLFNRSGMWGKGIVGALSFLLGTKESKEEAEKIATRSGRRIAREIGRYLNLKLSPKPDILLCEYLPDKENAFKRYAEEEGIPLLPLEVRMMIDEVRKPRKGPLSEELLEELTERNRKMAKKAVSVISKHLEEGKEDMYVRVLTGVGHVIGKEGLEQEEKSALEIYYEELPRLKKGKHRQGTLGDMLEKEISANLPDIDFEIRYDDLVIESTIEEMMREHYIKKERERRDKAISNARRKVEEYKKELEKLRHEIQLLSDEENQ
ncbi:MAG: hypothetical protein J7K68_05025 [Candidatus Diapherotrites archaeon]|nr:hypothetical protein [Candidatus Diapherotrites archaeon]